MKPLTKQTIAHNNLLAFLCGFMAASLRSFIAAGNEDQKSQRDIIHQPEVIANALKSSTEYLKQWYPDEAEEVLTLFDTLYEDVSQRYFSYDTPEDNVQERISKPNDDPDFIKITEYAKDVAGAVEWAMAMTGLSRIHSVTGVDSYSKIEELKETFERRNTDNFVGKDTLDNLYLTHEFDTNFGETIFSNLTEPFYILENSAALYFFDDYDHMKEAVNSGFPELEARASVSLDSSSLSGEVKVRVNRHINRP